MQIHISITDIPVDPKCALKHPYFSSLPNYPSVKNIPLKMYYNDVMRNTATLNEKKILMGTFRFIQIINSLEYYDMAVQGSGDVATGSTIIEGLDGYIHAVYLRAAKMVSLIQWLAIGVGTSQVGAAHAEFVRLPCAENAQIDLNEFRIGGIEEWNSVNIC